MTRPTAIPAPEANRPLVPQLFPDAWLAPVLLRSGIANETQILAAAAAPQPTLWATAVAQGWVDDERIVAAIASVFRVQRADLARIQPSLAALVPEALARKYGILPIGADDRRIRVATCDPRNMDVEQALRFVTGRDVEFEVAAPGELAQRIEEFYRPERSIERLVTGLDQARVEGGAAEAPADVQDPALEAPMAKLVDAMIGDAVRERASDIHAEPVSGGVSVRYRVDGVLREIMRLPERSGPALVRRVKILAKLDVTDPLHPHDGRAMLRVNGQQVDLRVSTVPVARRGEKVVIRILDKTNLRADLAGLGLPLGEEAQLQRLLSFREGMILVTGPTGSGKTTTLYGALNQLKTGKVNIVTVEDPVEYDITGISQIQVSEAQGLTFASALRSVLRQDPDIVLVGEIRDLETATTAVQAGLTGHLVLSTLHTNDAPSAVVRLQDLGLDPYKVGSVLKGVVAQRLVRRLCDDCAVPIDVTDLPAEDRPTAEWTGTPAPRKAVGCRACQGTGFRGRIPIIEVMPVEGAVARLIEQAAPLEAVVSAARVLGMKSLRDSALDRVWQGLTSLEEAVRVLGQRAHEDEAEATPARGAPAAPVAPPAAAAPPAAPGPATGDPWPPIVNYGTTAPPIGFDSGFGVVPMPGLVELPPADPLPAVGTAPDAAPVVSSRCIVVADDDPQMRKLVRMLLEREQFDVVEAADGLDALDAIETHRPSLCILDQDMPRLDGLGVLDEMQSRLSTSAIPVIMLTANSTAEPEALDLGAQDFLTKPVQPRSLVARVRAVLRRVAA